MIRNIRNEFINVLEESNWMDEETKSVAKEKVTRTRTYTRTRKHTHKHTLNDALVFVPETFMKFSVTKHFA